MPHGSRIALLTALVLTGCHAADKRGQQLLPIKPATVPAAADAAKPKEPTAKANPTGRSEAISPVVTNDKFRQPIAVSGTPQPGVAPPLGVPTLPTGVPGPAMADPTPPGAPGHGGSPQPPVADKGGSDFKVPSLMGPN